MTKIVRLVIGANNTIKIPQATVIEKLKWFNILFIEVFYPNLNILYKLDKIIHILKETYFRNIILFCDRF